MRVLKTILIGVVAIVLLFMFSLGLGVFLGTNNTLKIFVDNFSVNKKTQKQDSISKLQPQDIAKMTELYNQINAESRQKRIEDVEADGSRIVITLPTFKNSSVSYIDYVCHKDLPSDFRYQISVYKKMVEDGKTGYDNLLRTRPECYKQGGFFDYSLASCADILDEHISYYSDLMIKGSNEGIKYIKPYCEYLR